MSNNSEGERRGFSTLQYDATGIKVAQPKLRGLKFKNAIQLINECIFCR